MNILELCRLSDSFKEYTINMVKCKVLTDRLYYFIQASAMLEACLNLELISDYDFDYLYAVLNRLY